MFKPLLPDVKEAFEQGDGKELKGNPCRTQAVHSSAASAVNVFQYWKEKGEIPAIAQACGFCRKNNTCSQNLVFEEKYPISQQFRRAPNIDVVIKNTASAQYKVFAIECKFAEPYRGSKQNNLQKYLDLKESEPKLWRGLRNLYDLAKNLTGGVINYEHLDAAQLIKHILGLRKKYGKTRWRLRYLWFDTIGRESANHYKEIADFTETTKKDGIKFHSKTYQDLIIELAEDCRKTHQQYIDYLTERYL